MCKNLAPIKDFLRTELLLSPAAIEIALGQWQREQGPLPAILWRYGLVTLDQLTQIFDWMEQQGRRGELASADLCSSCSSPQPSSIQRPSTMLNDR